MNELMNRLSVVVVDNELQWRELLKEGLECECDVKTFSSVEEAEQTLDVADFDVIVLDVRFESENGFQRDVSGLRLLYTLRERKAKTGIVILTGYPQDVEKEFLEKCIPDAFILKDRFRILDFRHTIREIAQKYKHIQPPHITEDRPRN